MLFRFVSVRTLVANIGGPRNAYEAVATVADTAVSVALHHFKAVPATSKEELREGRRIPALAGARERSKVG